VIVLENGRITQAGTHAQLMGEDGHYRQIAAVQLYGHDADAEGRIASHMKRLRDPREVEAAGRPPTWARSPRARRGTVVNRLAAMIRRLRGRSRPAHGAAPPLPPQIEDDEPRYRPVDLKLLRRMLTWLRPYRRRYVLGISLGLVMVVLEMLSPLFMREIINLATGYGSGSLDPMPTRAA